MFRNIKVGESLWDLRYGMVKITHLNKKYIEAVNDDGITLLYNLDGYASVQHNYPLLIDPNNEFRLPKTHARIMQSNTLAQKNSRPKK